MPTHMCVCVGGGGGGEVGSGIFTVENPKVNAPVHHFYLVAKIQQELSHVVLSFVEVLTW